MCSYQQRIFPAFVKKSIYQKYLLLNYSQGRTFAETVKFIQEELGIRSLSKAFSMAATSKKGIQDTAASGYACSFVHDKIYAE